MLDFVSVFFFFFFFPFVLCKIFNAVYSTLFYVDFHGRIESSVIEGKNSLLILEQTKVS